MNATLAAFREHTAWAWEVSLGRRHLAGELAGKQEDPGRGEAGRNTGPREKQVPRP